MRASAAAERHGFPTVSIVGSFYVRQARSAARALGIDDPALAVYPGRTGFDSEPEFDEKINTVVAVEVVEGLLNGRPGSTVRTIEPGQREIVFRGSIDEVDELFYERLWTDGLPIIPPTIERVEAFLRHTGREPREIIGLLLPERREATVWSVAVNGVMAGCRPEYMPLLLALVEAIAEPEFRLEDAGSGIGWEPLITISGPVIKELDFNYGSGVRRTGRRANTSIGRFLRLYMRNVAGIRIAPADSDKSRLGSNFQIAIAEDEDTVRAIGWPTYGDDQGVPEGESAVTVQSTVAESPIFGEYGGPGDDPNTFLRPLVEIFGKSILGFWVFTGLNWSSWHPLLLVSPELATLLTKHGWTKDDLRSYVHREALVPAGYVERLGELVNLDIPARVREGKLPAEYHESDDPDRLLSTVIRPEWLGIVVTGGLGRMVKGLMNNHEHGPPTTKIIERQRPR